ncbi:hypothetical protein GCM10007392_24730 [Saccharospirillum salsuginis]|uniref:Uncharacterized protein n=1 Tax=Saccharospirillum salsuginis TaxID=418750 RepID=A0A918KC07_9GAMM|nr:hypothetical protein GCM10007392_24730 [Saccharospirillum salsuginis]
MIGPRSFSMKAGTLVPETETCPIAGETQSKVGGVGVLGLRTHRVWGSVCTAWPAVSVARATTDKDWPANASATGTSI